MPESAPHIQIPFRFCVIVFAMSAVLWLVAEMIGATPDIPVNLPVSSLMVVCPLIAACCLVWRREKAKGIGALFRRLADWRSVRHMVWYWPALILMPAVLFVSWLYMTLMWYSLPDPDVHLPLIPALFAVFLVGAAAEEAGWMPVPRLRVARCSDGNGHPADRRRGRYRGPVGQGAAQNLIDHMSTSRKEIGDVGEQGT